MLTGVVEVLYWGARIRGLGKSQYGHIALLITPSEPYDFSDIRYPQMLTLPGKLYVSFYTEGRYAAFHHDTNPNMRPDARPPDQRIPLYHLNVSAMLNKVKVLLAKNPTYYGFASTASLLSYHEDTPTNQYNCVSFALDVLFAGGLGDYISLWDPLWRKVECIAYHAKTWLLSAPRWYALSAFPLAFISYYCIWPTALKAKDTLNMLMGINHMIKSSVSTSTTFSLTPAEATIFNQMAEGLTTSPYAPSGMTRTFANLYTHNPTLFAVLLAIVTGILSYSTLLCVDGIKKWYITSPTDVLELVEKIAKLEALQQLPPSLEALSPYSCSSANTSHEVIPTDEDLTSCHLPLPIPTSSTQTSNLFGNHLGPTHFLPKKMAYTPQTQPDNETDAPLQSDTRCMMQCGFL